jgi:hypothetical protein
MCDNASAFHGTMISVEEGSGAVATVTRWWHHFWLAQHGGPRHHGDPDRKIGKLSVGPHVTVGV